MRWPIWRMKMKMRMTLKRLMVMKTTTAHAMKRRSQASRTRRPRITETVRLAVEGMNCRENAPSMIFSYLDRGSLGPGLTGAKSGCGPGDQGFKTRIINGSKPVGLRTRLVNSQEIFDVNVAVLVNSSLKMRLRQPYPLPNLFTQLVLFFSSSF